MAGLAEPMLPFSDGSWRKCGPLDGAVGRILGGSGTDLGWLATMKLDEYGFPSDDVTRGAPILPSSSISDSEGR